MYERENCGWRRRRKRHFALKVRIQRRMILWNYTQHQQATKCVVCTGGGKLKEGRRKWKKNFRRWWWRWCTCAVGMRVLSRLTEWENLRTTENNKSRGGWEGGIISFFLRRGEIHRELKRCEQVQKTRVTSQRTFIFLPLFLTLHWQCWALVSMKWMPFFPLSHIIILSKCNFYVINEFNNLMIFILNSIK